MFLAIVEGRVKFNISFLVPSRSEQIPLHENLDQLPRSLVLAGAGTNVYAEKSNGLRLTRRAARAKMPHSGVIKLFFGGVADSLGKC